MKLRYKGVILQSSQDKNELGLFFKKCYIEVKIWIK